MAREDMLEKFSLVMAGIVTGERAAREVATLSRNHVLRAVTTLVVVDSRTLVFSNHINVASTSMLEHRGRVVVATIVTGSDGSPRVHL